jgi:hypothetical protein
MSDAPERIWYNGTTLHARELRWRPPESDAHPQIEYIRKDTADAAVKAERAAASEYCWQRYQNREPMNLTSPAVFTSHSHQDIVEHMERAAAIRKGEQP